MITEILGKLKGTVRDVLIAVVVLGLIYAFGYCSGNKHGSAAKVVSQLVARNDSLKILTDSLGQVILTQQDDLVSAQTKLMVVSQKRDESAKQVHVDAPGKLTVLVQGTPKVIPVPVPVTDLLAADELTIDEAQKALVASENLIKSLQLQVQVEHTRAESNWKLYEAEKDSHGNSHLVLGFVLGALTAIGSILVFR